MTVSQISDPMNQTGLQILVLVYRSIIHPRLDLIVETESLTNSYLHHPISNMI